MEDKKAALRKLVKEILLREEQVSKYNSPETEGVIIECNGKKYLGSLQQIVKDQPEICLLSKTKYEVTPEMIKMVLEEQPNRTILKADPALEEFDGPLHILRRIGEILLRCTPEQTHYMIRHPPNVITVTLVKENSKENCFMGG
jgi:hypothetical protein